MKDEQLLFFEKQFVYEEGGRWSHLISSRVFGLWRKRLFAKTELDFLTCENAQKVHSVYVITYMFAFKLTDYL